MKTENTTKLPIYVALNMSKVLNNEESFDLMHKVGPRVCITTATHPGFVGFMANIQTGILPLAGRYGSFMLDPVSMAETLQTLGANPPRNPKPLFKTPDATPNSPEYLIHSEWDATEMAQPMMKDPGWRSFLP